MKAREKELTIGVVLVDHEGSSSLDLRLEDGVPELLGLDRLASTTFLLVSLIELFELFAVHLVKVWGFVRAEQRPVTVGLNTLHAVGTQVRV